MIETLKKYRDEGWLISQDHPSLPLTIWNYSRKTTYDRYWDSVTSMCRGLVTDFDGNIISHCIGKFHNIEEIDPSTIPNEPFEVTEKMDGSYISLFHYKGNPIITSRGSFISDQAVMAEKLFEQNYKEKVSLDIGLSYIMELIGEDNRIVVRYDENDLILLVVIDNKDGKELSIYDEKFDGFNRVKRYDGINDFNVLKPMISSEAEGMVIRFKSGFRMKVKGEEYIRLHRIITNISNRDIWERLKDGKPLDEILENVPDEFDNWVREKAKMYKDMYTITEVLIQVKYLREIGETEGLSRKDVALKILKQDKSLQSIFFNIYDGKDISHLIWERLYPKYEKPFKTNDI